MIGYNLTCETRTYFVYESDDGTHELYIKKQNVPLAFPSR